MPRKRIAVTFGELEELLRLVTPETVAEHPEIAPIHAQLQELVDQTRELMVKRDFHAARKQEATSEIQAKLEEGCRTATAVRALLRWRHRNRGEALAAFKVKPAHGRPRGSKSAKSRQDSPQEQDASPTPEP